MHIALAEEDLRGDLERHLLDLVIEQEGRVIAGGEAIEAALDHALHILDITPERGVGEREVHDKAMRAMLGAISKHEASLEEAPDLLIPGGLILEGLLAVHKDELIRIGAKEDHRLRAEEVHFKDGTMLRFLLEEKAFRILQELPESEDAFDPVGDERFRLTRIFCATYRVSEATSVES